MKLWQKNLILVLLVVLIAAVPLPGRGIRRGRRSGRGADRGDPPGLRALVLPHL